MTMCEGGCIRRTNIELDEDLVQEASELSSLETKKELVHLALKEFVENRGRRDVRELRGKVRFRSECDHKRLRAWDST